jgi:hypothetical protein
MAIVNETAQTLHSLYPLISPVNLLASANGPSDANWTKDGVYAGPYYNLTDYPTKRAFDCFGHLPTKPDAATPDDLWYYDFLIPAGATLEVFAIINHNFDQIPGGVAMDIQVADNSSFTSAVSLTSLVSTLTSKKRYVEIFANPVSGATHGRIALAAAANFVPEIGEFWLGEIIQIPTIPVNPFDDRKRLSNREDLVSLSGIISSFQTHYLGSEWEFGFQVGKDDAREAIRQTYIDSEGFKKLVLLTPDPDYPLDSYLAKGPSQLHLPLSGPYLRETDSFTFKESSPFRRAEGTLDAEDAGAY